MANRQESNQHPARLFVVALSIGAACLATGCAQSEAMQWAQTAPTIAPDGVRQPVNMGVRTDEPAKATPASRDASG